MPAAKSMEIHENIENSGSSSSRPSGMRPYLLKPTNSMNTRMIVAMVVKKKPKYSTTQASTVLVVPARLSPANTPHAMKARANAAATPNTSGSVR